jgi:hypothetical protein
MSCPNEKTAEVYARFSRDAMDLLGSLYEAYTQLAAEHCVIPSPNLDAVMKAFANLYVVTRLAHPVGIVDMPEPE